MDLKEYCGYLERRVKKLEEENILLRRELGMAERIGSAVEETAVDPIREDTVASIHKYSSSDEKIHLFRSLFCGREDVFARRWYSTKTEKSGYAPVCANEWRDGVCIKQKAAVQNVKTGSLFR